MGQLSKYKTQLEAAPIEPKFNEKVTKVAATLQGKPAAEIGELYCLLRFKKDRLQQRIKELNVELEATTRILVNWLETENMDKIRLKNGASLSIKDDVYVSVKEQAAWLQYVEENELQHMLSMHYGKMKSYVMSLMEEGQKVPDGLKAFFRQSIRPWGLPKNLDVPEEEDPEPEDE